MTFLKNIKTRQTNFLICLFIYQTSVAQTKIIITPLIFSKINFIETDLTKLNNTLKDNSNILSLNYKSKTHNNNIGIMLGVNIKIKHNLYLSLKSDGVTQIERISYFNVSDTPYSSYTSNLLYDSKSTSFINQVLLKYEYLISSRKKEVFFGFHLTLVLLIDLDQREKQK